MVIGTENKKTIIEKYGKNQKDTGSIEVQVAILTEEIIALTKHMQAFRKDNHSKLGLYKKVSKRNSLLKYLKGEDLERYTKLLKSLHLRG